MTAVIRDRIYIYVAHRCMHIQKINMFKLRMWDPAVACGLLILRKALNSEKQILEDSRKATVT